MILKKTLIIVLVICCLVFFPKTIKIGINEIKSIDYYHKINSLQLEEIYSSKKEAFVYFYKDDCVPCSSFKRTINKIIKGHDYLIYAINVKSSQDKEIQIIEKYKIKYTPTVIFFRDSKEQERIEGNISEEKVIFFLERRNK